MRRRHFLKSSALLPLAAGLHVVQGGEGSLLGKAEHCIMLWLGGGMAQMDTFDPKRMGDAVKNVPGSYYPSIKTAAPGVMVCEHLKRTAEVMDRMTVLRTVHHDVIDEHAAAVNRMHTGRTVSGTVQYPSIGSVVVHERKGLNDKVPPYVLMGYPSPTRGPGFLGASCGYLYLTDTESGPAGLTPPPGISSERQARREALLRRLRESSHSAGPPESEAARNFAMAQDQSFRLAGPEFMSVFDLAKEDAALREGYGGEFGQRCLLARRLVQRGVRFIEVAHNMNFVNGTGWDTHQKGQLQQHVLIRELDSALSSLVLDLERHKLLEKTLIVVSTEFGRPPDFDSLGGRGHHPHTFSVVLAGGGLKHRGAWGESDEVAKKTVKDPVSVPDLFATIYGALGIAPDKALHDGDRPVPVTDYGKAVGALFS
jgi:hypothetical protein